MRHINQAGLDLVKSFEGLRLKAYLDPVGIPTIGFGSTRGVRMGMVITKEKAEELLRADLFSAESCVDQYAALSATPNQFSAMVSLAFNIGNGAFKKSTLLKLFNANKTQEAADAFLNWNKGGGKVLPGLTRRRKAERELFLK